MHLTRIVLKDGKKFSSSIEKIRFDNNIFEDSYIKLFDYKEKFYIKDIKSAVTEKDRISINKIRGVDEIERMRKLWNRYKKGEIKGLCLV
jgi:hypothetical protein